MKKKWLCSICMSLVMMIGLTGCGSQMPNLSEEQMQQVSTYAAQLLLKYDRNEQSRLVELPEVEEKPAPTAKPVATEPPKEESSGMGEVADIPVIEQGGEEPAADGDMAVTMALPKNVSLELVDSQIVDSYTDIVDEELVIEATTGNKLLVSSFVLMNNGAEEQSIDMLQNNIKYTYKVGEKNVYCQMTMLSNDLSTYIGNLKADESVKVVLISECAEAALAGNIEIYLEVQREESKATIQVK